VASERLQKILSQAGVASRRASERLMLEGRVTVNGATVRELGTKADPAADDVRVDGRRITVAQHHRYIVLNKPRGYVTTRSDPQRRPTVMDLVNVRDYLYPVGRLDFESEGLLLLTNDGDLAAMLMHPRYGVSRVYEARVLGVPDAHDLARLSHGIVIEGRRTAPAEVVMIAPRARAGTGAHEEKTTSTLKLTLREGRNREVRRMCDAIGHPVERLARVAIGPLRDPQLKTGRWRDLTADELRALRRATQGARDRKREHQRVKS
jgi:23S rRNA pseudouridine2605 synthase